METSRVKDQLGVKELLQLFYFCVCSGQYGCKSELLEACESEGYIKVLFGSVAGICQGLLERIWATLLLLMEWPKL